MADDETPETEPEQDASAGDVVADVSGGEIVVVTASGDDDGVGNAESSVKTGVNPKRRALPGFVDTEIPALGFAAIAAGLFVVIAAVSFGVFSLVV